MAEAIADVGYLAGLVGYDGTDPIKVQVNADGRLEIVLPLEEALGARAYHYDGATWRRSNMLWGYNNTVSGQPEDTNLGAGAPELKSPAVGSGEVHVIHTINARVDSGTVTLMRVCLHVGGVRIRLRIESPPTTTEWYLNFGEWVLAEGDYIVLELSGITAGDAAYMRYCGSKMRVDM